MTAKGRINRLENISVRNVKITEAWQESGVLSGTDTVPVKFEEFRTFTRPVGPGAWRLSAIRQTS